MTTLLVVRHGHVEGILPERFRGRVDLPLTGLGWRQAAATAARIAAGWQPIAVYTSPLSRCIDTGQAIAQRIGAPAKVLPQISDMDYGRWQGRTLEDVRAAEPEAFDTWFARPDLVRPGDGDSLQDLVLRTADGLRMIRRLHEGQTVVVVGHGTTNRALLLQLLEQPLSAFWRLGQSPCGISEIVFDGTKSTVVRLNETGHLLGVAPG